MHTRDVQAITLVWVNVLLAVLEDVPMVTLTAAYVSATKVPAKPLVLVSMLMSAGAVYLKCGKLLVVKGLFDQKKDLSDRLHRKAHKLTSNEQAELEVNGIDIFAALDTMQLDTIQFGRNAGFTGGNRTVWRGS